MAKIVYNGCYGGFGLSDAGIKRYAELKGLTLFPEGSRLSIIYFIVPPDQRTQKWDETEVLWADRIERDDPILVQVVEELGIEANGMCANLKIHEVPDGTAYRIEEYDGNENVVIHDMHDWRIAGATRST